MKHESESRPLLLDPPSAARVLAISPRSLSNLTRDGAIPSLKLRGLRRYRVVDLEKWLSELAAEQRGLSQAA